MTMASKFFGSKLKNNDQVYLSYDDHRDNFGDILNPIIANFYGSKEVVRISKRNCHKYEHYFMIGSILQRCTKHSIIWGSGILTSDSEFKEKPKKVLAVRGPLTRKKLLDMGVDCPEVYGDPALLLPELYPGKDPIKKYKLGIVPHFRDKNNAWLKKYFSQNPAIKIVDIQNKNPLKVVDDILECEKIISSSLHGVIVGDAYNIPSVWVELSDRVEGKGFKFQDYFKSVGRTVEVPFQLSEFETLDEILSVFKPYTTNINLSDLKASFPY